MTPRERFWKFAAREPGAEIPFWGDWVGPIDVWRKQGLPAATADVDRLGGGREWFCDYYGFDGIYSYSWGTSRVPVFTGLYPGFPAETVEETDKYIISRDGEGTLSKRFKHNEGGIVTTQDLSHAISTRKDWERLRDGQLDPGDPGRYPDEKTWKQLKEGWKNRRSLLTIDGGGFYGVVRNWMGVENVSYALYDDPEWVREMFDTLADFYCKVLLRAVTEVDIDFAMFWEDMCYKTGPLMSPSMFRKMVLPCYKKVTAFLREHGVRLSWVDCDGNIESLLPLFLEGGVEGFYPLEVASDMDAGKLLEEYGEKILLWGNVDKRALARGGRDLENEVARVAEIAKRGGFIPLVDHGVPHDVSLENYNRYVQLRKELIHPWMLNKDYR